MTPGHPLSFAFAYLSWFGILFVPVAGLVLWPLWLFATSPTSPGASRWRLVGSTVATYLIVASFTGWFGYHFVAAQYTRALLGTTQHTGRGSWSWPPHSSPLGDIHGDMLHRAATPGAYSADYAVRARQIVAEERAAYWHGWLRLAAIGMPVTIVPMLLLLLLLPRHSKPRRALLARS
ncbi:MAG TPA: hypothetical protein VGW38_24935 [Chloroflexota bacterium]|nr:hypothetical protein [Chloroflexota bacterium]